MQFLDESIKQALQPLGAAFQEIKKFSLEEQEMIYGAGFSFYETGNYEKASLVFTQLILSQPFDKRFWKGLASSRQLQKEYKAALHAWAIVCLLDDEDPTPHFHAAENFLFLNDTKEALKALKCAKTRCTNNELSEKIDALFDSYSPS